MIKIRVEENLISFSPDSRLLFTGNGVSLISSSLEPELPHVNVVDEDSSWILKANADVNTIVSGQVTEEIIVIETSSNGHKSSSSSSSSSSIGNTNNALEIWNRTSRSLITRIELEDKKSAGVYKCFRSRIMIYNKVRDQFTFVDIREGKIVQKITFGTEPIMFDFPNQEPLEIVAASQSAVVLRCMGEYSSKNK